MKRLLIALLALLTGLAVQAAPAAARGPGLAIGAEVDPGAANCAAIAARKEHVEAVANESWPTLATTLRQTAVPRDFWPVAPTVCFGPDRARE